MKIHILLACLLFSYNLFSQPIPDSTKIKIDKIFSQWNSKESPGCVIGVVRNDSLIFAKGYGMANMEYTIPNDENTIYHMASVSKQFTAYCIVLLAREGKLDLDDDIRKHLHWFPDLHEKITIRNLLNHTSGIRDQWQLLAISGTRLDDVIMQEQVIKILSQQTALNFKPNEQAIYSNSGYTLLAEIVKSVSGRSLRQYADSAIFKPLNMSNTHFHDDYTEIVKNRSYSYSRVDSVSYANAILSYSTVGPSSLFTTVTDLSKWASNFYAPIAGDKKDIETLTISKTKLDNGKEMDYAFGIVNGNYKGQLNYVHSGGDAGYRTLLMVFPDTKMGFILLSNLDDLDGEKLYSVVDLFLKDASAKAPDKKKKERSDSSKMILKDPKAYTKFKGNYIDDQGIRFSFSILNKKVYWHSYGKTRLMQAIKDTLFLFTDPTIKFIYSTNGKDTVLTEYWPENQRMLHKYTTNFRITEEQLKAYTGKYYSKELDCYYNIILKDYKLYFRHSKYPDVPIELQGPDHLTNDYWWMDHLKVLRNANGGITGFEVNSDRVQHLVFDKSGVINPL